MSFAKHGISFEEAGEVFDDPLAVFTRDVTHSIDEERYLGIGMTSRGRHVIVAFTIEPGGIIVRLISARRPTRRERDAYEGGPWP